jgi:type II restriction/modification system DNA methylase subunit YeeA
MADLYVYFYELGVRLLKPGGLLCYIVTNKWMKAGYGEPLRRFFSEKQFHKLPRWVKPIS